MTHYSQELPAIWGYGDLMETFEHVHISNILGFLKFMEGVINPGNRKKIIWPSLGIQVSQISYHY